MEQEGAEGWQAGAYWEVIAAKAPILSNCSLRYCRVASYWGAAGSFFYPCTANLGNAASPGGEELRMHVKSEEFAQTWETVTQGECPVRGWKHHLIVKAVILRLLWKISSMHGGADPPHTGGLHGLQEHSRHQQRISSMPCLYIFSEVIFILSQLQVLFSLSVCTGKKVGCLPWFL